MSFKDSQIRVPIKRFTIGAAADTKEVELSVLQSRVSGSNFLVRSLNLCLCGNIATDSGEIDYWLDVIAAKLTQILFTHNGESTWDLGSRAAIILQAQEAGYAMGSLGYKFTASVARRVRFTIRLTMGDAGYGDHWSMCVPSRALHDDTLSLAFAADGNYPFTDMSCKVSADGYLLKEDWKKYIGPEYKTDKINWTDDDLKLGNQRIYNRVSIIRPPDRSAGGHNDQGDSVFNVYGDETFVQNLYGYELYDSFCKTNPWIGMGNDELFWIHGTDDLADHMSNVFFPILWPGHREGINNGQKISKGYSCYTKQLVLNQAVGAVVSHAAPHPMLATWFDVKGNERLAREAAQLGLANAVSKTRTLSKAPVKERLAERVLPGKVTGKAGGG